MKSFKKIFAALLAVVMVMGSFPIVAGAAADFGLKMTITYDEDEGVVEAVVTAVGDDHTAGYVDIKYDTDALVPLDLDGNEVTSDLSYDAYIGASDTEAGVFDVVSLFQILIPETDYKDHFIPAEGSLILQYLIWASENPSKALINDGEEMFTVRFKVEDADAVEELASKNKLVYFGDFSSSKYFNSGYVIRKGQKGRENYYFTGESPAATTKYEYEGVEVDTKTEVTIVVLGEDGKPIEGAKVTIGGKTVTTNEKGEATFTVAKGTYNATVSIKGYVEKSVTVTADGENNSDPIEAEIEKITVPGVPKKLTKVSAGTSSVKIKWEAPSDDGNSPITGYIVSYGTTSSASSKTVEITSAKTLEKQITGLSDDTKYYFKVAAVNEVGQGEFCDAISITTDEKSGGGGSAGGSSSGSQTTVYIVTYDLSGGTIVSGSTKENVNAGKTPSTPPEFNPPAGKIFKGWSTDGNTVKDLETIKVTKNITLRAVYEDKPATPTVVKHTSYMTGYTDGTAKPDKSITRAEAATFIARVSADFDESATYSGVTFTDVPANAWYKKYVDFASSKKIITGYTDGTFKPNKEISREEFSTMMVRLAGFAADNSKSFSDVPDTHWAKTNISTLAAKEIITGYTDGTFGLGKKIKRCEAVTMINRYLGRVPDTALVKAYCDANKYPATDIATHWAFAQMVEAMVEHEATAFHK